MPPASDDDDRGLVVFSEDLHEERPLAQRLEEIAEVLKQEAWTLAHTDGLIDKDSRVIQRNWPLRMWSGGGILEINLELRFCRSR